MPQRKPAVGVYAYITSGGMIARQKPSTLESGVARLLVRSSVPQVEKTRKNPLSGDANSTHLSRTVLFHPERHTEYRHAMPGWQEVRRVFAIFGRKRRDEICDVAGGQNPHDPAGSSRDGFLAIPAHADFCAFPYNAPYAHASRDAFVGIEVSEMVSLRRKFTDRF